MKFLGVDAGVKGAFALLNTESKEIQILDMPLIEGNFLDSKKLFIKMSEWNPEYLIIEDCWQPKKLVRMCGEIVCIGKILDVDINIIAVTTWKKAMLGRNTSDKSESIALCKKLQPQVNLMLTPRCTKPSADRAEAVLLALYAAKICPLAENSSK